MGSQVSPYLLPPTPWEFLLAAGRATAAIFSPSRELFATSSHWAIVRWLWALDWSTTSVALSPHSTQIRNHHRIAFSEALGLAAGLLLVEHVAGAALPYGLSRGGPMIVDVDSYVSHGERPDLLILFGRPDRETYVLEAKGNSSGRPYSITQLKRGIEQVLAAPGDARRLVVGASAPGPDLDVHAVSVEPDDASERSDDAAVSGRKALPLELRRLTSFAGVPSLEEKGDLHSIPELEVDLVGRQLSLAGDDLTAVVTMGVDREVFRRLPEVGSIGELAEMRATVSRAQRPWSADQGETDPLTEMRRAATVAEDGCALAIELR